MKYKPPIFTKLLWLGWAILIGTSCKSINYTIDKRVLQGKRGDAFRYALHHAIDSHQKLSYNRLWDAFRDTDLRKDSSLNDIYSFAKKKKLPYRYLYGQRCGNYKKEGECYNREHSFPKGWWGGKEDTMFTDLHHIYPTDGYVNGLRSDFPYGEVSAPTRTTLNGGKLGPNITEGYSGTVFEPIDRYKGDLARTYFYMLTRYAPRISAWKSPMLEGDDFSPWAKSLLLQWHRQDPVSDEERRRNQAILGIQGNINPFVIHPHWVKKIWRESPE